MRLMKITLSKEEVAEMCRKHFNLNDVLPVEVRCYQNGEMTIEYDPVENETLKKKA
jgi:hypothetical protein